MIWLYLVQCAHCADSDPTKDCSMRNEGRSERALVIHAPIGLTFKETYLKLTEQLRLNVSSKQGNCEKKQYWKSFLNIDNLRLAFKNSSTNLVQQYNDSWWSQLFFLMYVFQCFIDTFHLFPQLSIWNPRISAWELYVLLYSTQCKDNFCVSLFLKTIFRKASPNKKEALIKSSMIKSGDELT